MGNNDTFVNMDECKKMSPETAIEVLKRMGSFFKLAKCDMEHSGWNAVDIAVAALEEKIEL